MRGGCGGEIDAQFPDASREADCYWSQVHSSRVNDNTRGEANIFAETFDLHVQLWFLCQIVLAPNSLNSLPDHVCLNLFQSRAICAHVADQTICSMTDSASTAKTQTLDASSLSAASWQDPSRHCKTKTPTATPNGEMCSTKLHKLPILVNRRHYKLATVIFKTVFDDPVSATYFRTNIFREGLQEIPVRVSCKAACCSNQLGHNG